MAPSTRKTTFVDKLNISDRALPQRGGVWVMDPPYLLFYPRPRVAPTNSGDPVVHLSVVRVGGHGIRSPRACAGGRTAGSTGANGSTCTAKVKCELCARTRGCQDDRLPRPGDLKRYHPERHVFGTAYTPRAAAILFGVAFDDVGRVYSGDELGQVSRAALRLRGVLRQGLGQARAL